MVTPPEALVNSCQFVGRLLPEVQQCRLKGQQKPRGLTLLLLHETIKGPDQVLEIKAEMLILCAIF